MIIDFTKLWLITDRYTVQKPITVFEKWPYFLKFIAFSFFVMYLKYRKIKKIWQNLVLILVAFPTTLKNYCILSRSYFLKKDISQIILLNSEPKMFCKKAFLRNFRTSTEKDFCSSSLFIKVACLECLIFSIFKT